MFSIQLCVCRIKLPRWPQRPTAQSSTPLWTRSGSSAPLPLTSSPCCSTPCCTGALEPRMRLHMSTYRAACLRCWMTLLYLRQPFPQGQLQVGCSMCHQARCQWVTTLLFQTCQRTFHPTATQSAIQQFLWGHPLWMLHPPCHSSTIP